MSKDLEDPFQVFGWARRDGSFRTEVPDNPIGWTPLYASTAFAWVAHADLLEALKELAKAVVAENPTWAYSSHLEKARAAIAKVEGGDA